MGMFSFLFRTQDEKIRDCAVKMIENAHGYASSGVVKIGSLFMAGLTGKSVKYSWKTGTVAEKYKDCLEGYISQVNSEDYTKFEGEDKEKLLKLLNDELDYVNKNMNFSVLTAIIGEVETKMSRLEKGIIERATQWTPPINYDPRLHSIYGKEIYKEKFNSLLGIRK